ncbi:unnamed protein product [Prorocentrum cordatum]|uniref:Uncharacterized protein n=1 Tax=Prorocentrum cordatum TaxID=2364126 RepID=A0ABN9UGD3_9DINO|nr:unnamed protein product [Polarella glacialis]
MREATVEPDAIFSYSAGISACEKGEQWEQALALLSEMREAKVEPDVISYSAGISACEKGDQWQRAVALLRELWAAKLEPDVILIYNAGISACEKGEQWQWALLLFGEMREARVEPSVTSYSAGISACGKLEQWHRALALLGEMRHAKLEPNIVLRRWRQRVRESELCWRVGLSPSQAEWLRTLSLPRLWCELSLQILRRAGGSVVTHGQRCCKMIRRGENWP